MKHFLLLIILNLFLVQIHAQQAELVFTGTSNDSSYYDIFKVSENEFWAAGKYGILSSMDTNGNITSVNYPSQGEHLLNIKAFDEKTLLISADKGSYYIYNKEKNKWSFHQLQEFANKSFYNIQVANKNTAFICGGSSKVSFGQKSVPNGFIIRTTDQGKTWEKIYSNPFYMIWNMHYDGQQNKIYAILYSFFGSKLIWSDADEINWQKIDLPKKWLYHHVNMTDGELMLTGVKKRDLKGQGIIVNPETGEMNRLTGSGMVWSGFYTEDYNIFSGSHGYIFWQKKDEKQINRLSVPVDYHLYKTCRISEDQFYVIGSNRTIVKLDLSTTHPDQLTLKN